MLPLAEEMMTPNGAGTHLWHEQEELTTVASHRVWTIAGGPILILALWGIVRVGCNAPGGTTLRLAHNVGPANLCANIADIDSDPLGTVYYITGIQGSALLKAELGTAGIPTIATANLTPIPAYAGDIDAVVGGNTNTGEVEWHLVYRALSALSTVVNAVYD